MSRTPRLPSLPIRPPKANEKLGDWLYRELRSAILEGRLRAGTLLPPTRTLARNNGVSRGTVVSVFEQMIAEGYLESRPGSGTSVHRHLPDRFFEAPKASVSSGRFVPGRLSQRSRLLMDSPFPKTPEALREVRAFTANRPSVRHFPADLWSRLISRRIRLATREILQAGDVAGLRSLREGIASHLAATRGIVCDPAQIFIFSGIQPALDLIARLTLDPGDEAWMEDPGYPGARGVLRAAEARVIPVPVDHHGLQVEEGIDRAPHARFAYVTPANQFPLCVTLPLNRRLQLIEWSRSTGAWIFEDDYDSEFRFDGRPLAALCSLAPDSNVIFSGSFSKMLFPSMRMAYVVVPPHLVDPLTEARSLLDRFTAPLAQAVLADFIAEGHFDRHLRRMRQVYAEHLATLTSAANAEWGDRLAIQPAHCGLQTVGWLAKGFDDVKFCQAARGAGVALMPLSSWAMNWKNRNAVQIGFAAAEPDELRRGVRAVARLLE